MAVETTEKTVARNSVEYPNIDDKIMENLKIYPELDDKIIEMMNLAEEERKVKQTVNETQT